MSDLYDELAATANELLAEFGQPVTIVRNSTTGYNRGKPAVSQTTMTGTGLAMAYNNSEVNGTTIYASDVKVIVAPAGLTDAPKKDDTITVVSPFTGSLQTFNIATVKATAPGGTVILYEIQARA